MGWKELMQTDFQEVGSMIGCLTILFYLIMSVLRVILIFIECWLGPGNIPNVWFKLKKKSKEVYMSLYTF